MKTFPSRILVCLLALCAASLPAASGVTVDEWLALASAGDVAALGSALDRAPELLEAADADGVPALGRATANGHLDAVRFLLKRGADPNPPMKYGLLKSAMFLDVYEERGELFRLLVENGTEVNPARGITPLIQAVMLNRARHARFLLENGADPAVVLTRDDGLRRTALDMAQSEELRALLTAHGGLPAAAIPVPEVEMHPDPAPVRETPARRVGKWVVLILAAAFGLFWFSPAFVRRRRDPGSLEPERNAAKGSARVQLGCLFYFLGAVLLGTAWLRVWGNDVGAVAVAVAGVLAIGMGLRMAKKGRALRSTSATEAVEKDRRPPILFLRAFNLDDQDPGVEQSLVFALKQAGPVIAIGKPGESVALPGAHRDYVSDDDWQDQVLGMIDGCRFTAWVYGSTEGLKWEIRNLVKTLPPEKIVIVLPWWDVPVEKRADLWREARATLDEVLPMQLPEECGAALFVRFGPDWTPALVSAEKRSLAYRIATLDIHNPLTDGALALLKGFGADVDRRGANALYNFIAVLGWIILGVLAVLLYGLVVTFSR